MVCLLTEAARLHITRFLIVWISVSQWRIVTQKWVAGPFFNRTDSFEMKNMKVTIYCMFLQNDELNCFQYKLIFLLEACHYGWCGK